MMGVHMENTVFLGGKGPYIVRRPTGAIHTANALYSLVGSLMPLVIAVPRNVNNARLEQAMGSVGLVVFDILMYNI